MPTKGTAAVIKPVANPTTPDEWIRTAKRLFALPKPEHFTNYRHCCECAEHDETLLAHDVDSIGLEQLGNPGWDPICFSSATGLVYYMPALVRLTLQTLELHQVAYLEQFLFHLHRLDLLAATNLRQRQFVVAFLEYLIDQEREEVLGMNMRSHFVSSIENYADDLLEVLQIWSSREVVDDASCSLE